MASNTMKVMPGSKLVVAEPATASLTTHGNLNTIENRERTGEPQEYVPFEKTVGSRLGEAYGIGPPQLISQMGLQIQMMTGIPVFFGGCTGPWGPGPW